ncbi:hypothetical protein JAAARDRAFT_41422 [Jaapia argillacea MUCL 33604]|uniref:Uncharacterized protein n=1 Tax=Jaapia argillacea MUCL 33604 TaxID=933084 RepID=A0A067P8C4_9AGAM|nr:hypothetical protein JAAARDRAFT_41422 [Jaapia argillacea MUCL 33604]
MQTLLCRSLESLASAAETDTVVGSDSIFSVDASETTTLRSPSRFSLYTLPSATHSQDTIRDRTSAGLGILRAAQRVLMVLRRRPLRTETAPSGSAKQRPSPSSPPSGSGKEYLDGSKSLYPMKSIPTDKLSSLFNRYGIIDLGKNPADATKLDQITIQITSPRDYSCLEVLNQSIGLPKLLGLHASVHEPHAETLHTLTAFVEKLSSVTCIWLYFCLEGLNEGELSGGIGVALSRFLCAVSSSGCVSLSICQYPYRHCSLCSQRATPSGVGGKEKEASKEKRFSSPTSSLFKPAYPLPSAGAPTLSNLSSLHISLPLMLIHPWIDWTIRTINASNLSSLDLAALPSPDLSLVLPLISSPQLMCLLTHEAELADLIPFLSRHKEINCLSAMKIPGVFPEPPPKPSSFPAGFTLPQLIAVVGTPGFIFHLLSQTEQSARPRLSSFNISTTEFPHDHHLDKILPFLHTIQAIRGIHLPNVQFTCTLPCLECLTWLITQPMAILRTSKSEDGVYHIRLAYTSLPSERRFPFDDMQLLLPRWLSSFPCLKEFTLEFGRETSRSVDDERELMEGIRKSCPGISVVAVA